MKSKRKQRKVVVVPVKDLTYVEQAYKAMTKAYRALRKRMKGK